MTIGLLNWFIDNCIKGLVFSAFVSATQFFVTGEHIGEQRFIIWFIVGTIIVTVTRILDAVHRANLIMEKLKNDN